jgi:CubicO group peptidase (beta-lactamase class C family)
MTATNVQGHVEDGWGPVADAFRANFEGNPGEAGAACCVYAGGRPVVDLWGGYADSTAKRPWNEDTIVQVASTTKGATAICAHMLVQRGELDLDAPVVEYWPEFGANGKEQIPVRWLLSHQAGLPVIDTPLTIEEAYAWDPVIHALEAQKPLWVPGTEHVYHSMTFGYLVGEVVRRISGRSLGTFFADEVAGRVARGAGGQGRTDRVRQAVHAGGDDRRDDRDHRAGCGHGHAVDHRGVG